jgi:hypothetical protein
MSKRTSTANILASTFGWDIGEVSHYRYQSTRTRQAIYSVGKQYFAVGQQKPKDNVAGEWTQYVDQFWAKESNTILWVCE